ncbi:MAG: glycosyltransferase family 4 protein [Gemmataceae bacterium]
MSSAESVSPLWIVASATNPSGVIGGGSQSARNLLIGLREGGLDFTLVTQALSAESSATRVESEFGPGLRLGLPTPSRWAEPTTVATIRRLLAEHRPRLIHLLEPMGQLGAWIEAGREYPAPLVYTALDYNWLCVHAHLITRRGVPCPGPHSSLDCLQCHFDHREPLARLGLKVARAIAVLPRSMRPPRLASAAEAWSRESTVTPERLAALPADFARLDALIAPSKALADRFVANGFPRRKVHHVPYGTRPGTRIPLADRPPLSDGVVVGFAGRLEFDKGADQLLDSLAEIRRTTPHRPRLVVYAGASSTGFNRGIRGRMASAAFRDWTTLAQFDGRDPAALDSVHRGLHVFAAPSRWTDNLPNSVLEALERRTPVVAPDQGSFVEMIEHGCNGWLYPSHEPNALTNLLRTIVGEPQRHLDMPFDVVRTRTPAAEAADVRSIYTALGWTDPS